MALFAWCFIIFVAAFMPWGKSGFIVLPISGATLSQIATGWTGHISVIGILIPNWVVVVIAAAIAFIGWLRANSVEVKPNLSLWLTLYGLIHTIIFLYSAITFRGTPQLGIGSIITVIAFVVIMLQLRKLTSIS